MKQYARDRARELVEKLAEEVSRTKGSADPDAVHDLRVTIRRLSGCLRAFGQFYPAAERNRVRRRLSRLMDLAAAVRDRDITLELAKAAGVPSTAPVIEQLRQQRSGCAGLLSDEAGRWKRRKFGRRFREELGL